MPGINPLSPPVDYLKNLPQFDFGGDILNAAKVGAVIQEQRQKQQAADDAKAMQDQYATDLQRTFQKPSAAAFAALSAKYPQQREAFKQSWDMLEGPRKDAEWSTGVQAYHALSTGNTQTALDMLNERITAEDNAGQDSSKLKTIKAGIERDPAQAANYLALTLSALEPEKWSKVATEQRAAAKGPQELAKLTAETTTEQAKATYALPKAQAEAAEATAKAEKAAVDSRFAESQAVADLNKKGWETWKLQEDVNIAKLNNQIAAAHVAVAKEGNVLKRDELNAKLLELKQKRDEEVRDKAATVSSARSTLDNSLNTIDRALKAPGLRDVLGSLEGAPYYPNILAGGATPFGSTADERADAIALIDTINSQVFLAQIKDLKQQSATGASGLGALSEKEGDRLMAGIQNLGRRQSEKQWMTNAQEVQRLMLKMRGNLTAKYGVPETVPDTPAAASTPGTDIDALIRKYAPQ